MLRCMEDIKIEIPLSKETVGMGMATDCFREDKFIEVTSVLRQAFESQLSGTQSREGNIHKSTSHPGVMGRRGRVSVTFLPLPKDLLCKPSFVGVY